MRASHIIIEIAITNLDNLFGKITTILIEPDQLTDGEQFVRPPATLTPTPKKAPITSRYTAIYCAP